MYEIARKVKTLKVIILGTGARESTAITAGRWLRENPCTFELLLFRFFNLVDRAGGAATAHLTSGAPAHLFYSVPFGPGFTRRKRMDAQARISRPVLRWVTRGRGHGKCGAGHWHPAPAASDRDRTAVLSAIIGPYTAFVLAHALAGSG